MPDKVIVASIIEAALVLSGLVLLWRLALSPAARERAGQPAPLPYWDVPAYSYALAAVLVLGTSVMFRAFIFSLTKKYAPELSHTHGLGSIIDLLASHSGFVLGVGAAWYMLKSSRFLAEVSASSRPSPTSRRLDWKYVPIAALATFAILLVFKGPVFFVFTLLLKTLGIAAENQDAVALFKSAQSPLEITLMAISACIVVPLSEELVFRAGLFRYLRGRIPRWITLVGTALLFTSLHFSIVALPSLFFFAIIQAIAYERTGRIAVPIIAHALFNLHSAIAIVADVNPYDCLTKWLP
jgi:membrane protease YdiL (CAAX protease family)